MNQFIDRQKMIQSFKKQKLNPSLAKKLSIAISSQTCVYIFIMRWYPYKKLNWKVHASMHKPNPNKPVATVLENVCVILVLPSPPSDCFADDWYWRRICGVPFLMRNVFNLQRVGLNSLIVYSNENTAELYERLSEEKRISIKF